MCVMVNTIGNHVILNTIGIKLTEINILHDHYGVYQP